MGTSASDKRRGRGKGKEGGENAHHSVDLLVDLDAVATREGGAKAVVLGHDALAREGRVNGRDGDAAHEGLFFTCHLWVCLAAGWLRASGCGLETETRRMKQEGGEGRKEKTKKKFIKRQETDSTRTSNTIKHRDHGQFKTTQEHPTPSNTGITVNSRQHENIHHHQTPRSQSIQDNTRTSSNTEITVNSRQHENIQHCPTPRSQSIQDNTRTSNTEIAINSRQHENIINSVAINSGEGSIHKHVTSAGREESGGSEPRRTQSCDARLGDGPS